MRAKEKVIQFGVRLRVGHYTALMRRAAREGVKASVLVRRALELMLDMSDVEPEPVSSNGKGKASAPDEVEGRNPLEYVRAVREELERRARQHVSARR